MKFAIYLRVSTQEQNLDNQRLPLIQYAERMGWEYEVFEEKESTRHTRPIQWELYNNKAEEHHHYTIPYKFSKFWYVCKKCHGRITQEGKDVFLESQRWN